MLMIVMMDAMEKLRLHIWPLSQKLYDFPVEKVLLIHQVLCVCIVYCVMFKEPSVPSYQTVIGRHMLGGSIQEKRKDTRICRGSRTLVYL